jgi:hypothetical protein
VFTSTQPAPAQQDIPPVQAAAPAQEQAPVMQPSLVPAGQEEPHAPQFA